MSYDINPTELKELLDSAAELGAKRALASVGLADETAAADMRDLRDVMKSWRLVKSTAAHAILRAFGRIFTFVVVAAVAAYAGKHGIPWPQSPVPPAHGP